MFKKQGLWVGPVISVSVLPTFPLPLTRKDEVLGFAVIGIITFAGSPAALEVLEGGFGEVLGVVGEVAETFLSEVLGLELGGCTVGVEETSLPQPGLFGVVASAGAGGV